MRYTVILVTALCINVSVFGISAGQPYYGTYGAKNVGTGGAFGALVSDPSSLLYNPAGLAHINGREKSAAGLQEEAEEIFDDPENPLPEDFWENPKESGKKTDTSERTFEMQIFSSYGQLTLDRRVAMAAVGFTVFGGTLGIGFLGTMVENIQGYNVNGVATQQLAYRYGDILIGYAREAGIIRYGFSINAMQEYLGNANLYGGGVNFGMQLAPIPMINIGMTLKNLVGVYQRSVSSDRFEKMDTLTDLSFAISPPTTNVRLMLSFNKNLDALEEPAQTNFGVMFLITKFMYLMGGLQNGNLAFGAGIELSFLNFSYAVNQDSLRTGFQHFVDLNFTF